MQLQFPFVRRAAQASAASLVLILAGCAGSLTSTPTTSAAIAVSGNWQISSTSASASRLPALSGALSGSSASVQGVFHSDSTAACIAPSSSFDLSGSADANMLLTLTGSVAGGTLTLTGTLASDGKSLSGITYNIAGGACGFSTPANGTAQEYADISGTYNGTFFDGDSSTIPVLSMSAQLSQSPTGDSNGNFTLTGQMTAGQNPCFSVPTALTSAQVTGGSFTMTYTDATLGNTVTAGGTFSADGKSLTVTNWQLSGNCGVDTGTGALTQQ